MFKNFAEFLCWAHQDIYNEKGRALASTHNSIPVNIEDINDAKQMAKLDGDENLWPRYYETIVYRNNRITDDLEEELEDSL